jgi:hypothetical protein
MKIAREYASVGPRTAAASLCATSGVAGFPVIGRPALGDLCFETPASVERLKVAIIFKVPRAAVGSDPGCAEGSLWTMLWIESTQTKGFE